MVNEEEKIKTLLEDISLLESYAHDLFTFTPLPLCFVNPKGMVLEVNPAFVKKTEHNEYDVVGENLSLFIEKEVGEKLLKKVIEESTLEGEKIMIKKKDESQIPVMVSAKIRKTKEEGINGAFFSFFDLAGIEEKEKEVEESNLKLQEKIEEMEKINKLTIGRELKMVELKEEIEKLKEELEKYKEGK
jgi:transcriptional regulator with PAS, ATPase and Fis domain